MKPHTHERTIGDVTLSYAEWNAQKRGHGPTFLFVHATGFHGRLWDEIAKQLPNYHLICIDQRGHGRSSGGIVESWDRYGADLTGFVEALDLQNISGVGHSMGGHVLIETAAQQSARFRNLLLIDPVVMAPEAYEAPHEMTGEIDKHPIARRRNEFSSPEEMFERYKDRSPYSLYTRETLRNYCDYGLLRKETGEGYQLACAPKTEASIYMNSLTHKAIFDHVRAVTCPVLVLRAKQREEGAGLDFSTSPTWPGLARHFQHARDLHWPEHSHFIPMEVPDKTLALIRQEAGISSGQ